MDAGLEWWVSRHRHGSRLTPTIQLRILVELPLATQRQAFSNHFAQRQLQRHLAKVTKFIQLSVPTRETARSLVLLKFCELKMLFERRTAQENLVGTRLNAWSILL